MVFLDADGEGPALGFGAMRLELAGPAIFKGKLDADYLVAILIDSRGPTGTVSSSRAAHFLGVPIHRETGGVKALLLFRLPLVISSGWGDQIDPVLLATLHKLLGFGVIRVSQVLSGQQLLVL